MPDTTLEDARRCYRCEEPGIAIGTRPCPERRMGIFHMFRCANERCKGYGRDWLVQVRPDGTIPDATMNREKMFPVDKDARERIDKARARADATLNQSIG